MNKFILFLFLSSSLVFPWPSLRNPFKSRGKSESSQPVAMSKVPLALPADSGSEVLQKRNPGTMAEVRAMMKDPKSELNQRLAESSAASPATSQSSRSVSSLPKATHDGAGEFIPGMSPFHASAYGKITEEEWKGIKAAQEKAAAERAASLRLRKKKR